MSASLFTKNEESEAVQIWRPRALKPDQWPPDYDAVYRWRAQQLVKLRADPELLKSAKTYYSTRPAEFIMDWMDTYDPRSKRKWMPFVFFERQYDLVQFLQDCCAAQEGGLIEKPRDMGVTWVACAWTDWRWIFLKDDAVGWGSRKEKLVDEAGIADSIFEKLRLLIRRLPDVFRPEGFTERKHATFMKLINPENGATVTGEAGDNIGRGGRTAVYMKDEAAHYERPEKVEKALGDNTNVQIDMSSVNGLGNPFHRRAEKAIVWERNKKIPKGYVRKFIMDWRDHPLKTQEWYDTRKAKYEREGMLHIFAQEVDRNYSAAVSNTVIPYEWIRAAVDAHLCVPYIAAAWANIVKEKTQYYYGGLDVADEGDDRNAFTLREWIIWRTVEEWGNRDPNVSARHAISVCDSYYRRIEVMYDSIGVGAAVKGEYNRLTQDENIIKQSDLPFVPWNAGASVLEPFNRIIPDDDDSLLNKDFFENLKAQGWWSLRTRFYKTWKAVNDGIVYPVDDLISLDSSMPLLDSLCKELAQPTHVRSSKLKTMIDKQPKGTKSPNLADSGMMAFFPIPNNSHYAQTGNYGQA